MKNILVIDKNELSAENIIDSIVLSIKESISQIKNTKK